MTKLFYVGGRTITDPTVELSWIFHLLASGGVYGEVLAGHLWQCAHVTPEFFELDDREDVFLAVAPAFFDILESDVGGHECGEIADGLGDLILVFEVGADEAEDGEVLDG